MCLVTDAEHRRSAHNVEPFTGKEAQLADVQFLLSDAPRGSGEQRKHV